MKDNIDGNTGKDEKNNFSIPKVQDKLNMINFQQHQIKI